MKHVQKSFEDETLLTGAIFLPNTEMWEVTETRTEPWTVVMTTSKLTHVSKSKFMTVW